MSQTAAQALNLPEYVSPAEPETLVRWAEEAKPVLDAYVHSAKVVRRLPKAVREEANRAHIVLALLATIVKQDQALRSVTAERNEAVLRLDAIREALEAVR